MASQGKRAGSRRAPKKKPSFRPRLLGLAVGVTAAVVAWGYLVYAAIEFGVTARGGETRAWWFLGVASLGAVACLFFGLMLVARLLRRLGITSDPHAEPRAVVSRGEAPSVAEALARSRGPVAGPVAGPAVGGAVGPVEGAAEPVSPSASVPPHAVRPTGGRRAAR